MEGSNLETVPHSFLRCGITIQRMKLDNINLPTFDSLYLQLYRVEINEKNILVDLDKSKKTKTKQVEKNSCKQNLKDNFYFRKKF